MRGAEIGDKRVDDLLEDHRWLVTTNDTLGAFRFYQRWGFALAAFERNAVNRSRWLKPEIPLIGDFGILLPDELTLEISLSRNSSIRKATVTLRVYSIAVDARDPGALADFWCQALGYRVANQDPNEVGIEPPDSDAAPGIVFGTVPEGKTIKNRIHLDLAPDDQEAEVERLLALGARRVDIGQGDVSWVVMADPEENEFCILTAR